MAVYVDDAAILYRGRPRYHMTADSLEELHAFAQRLGIHPGWFHRGARHPHYDIHEDERTHALALGAQQVDRRTIVRVARRLRTLP